MRGGGIPGRLNETARRDQPESYAKRQEYSQIHCLYTHMYQRITCIAAEVRRHAESGILIMTCTSFLFLK